MSRSNTLSWLVLLLGAITVLAGCGEPQPSPTPETGETGTQPAPPEPEAAAPPAEAEPEQAAEPATATLYRDEWGVPHIYADTEEAAAYAIGYAQAEDRLAGIHVNIRTATGRMAEVFGKEYTEQDYFMRLLRNAERCIAYWDEAPAHLKSLCEQYMAGVEAYSKEHPEDVPDYAVELAPWQCAAVGRTMILQWPMGNLMDEVKRKERAPDYGSNGWAVMPSRSAEDCAILLMDPHLSWEGLKVFYEMRVHAGDLHMCGFALLGTPLIALGHSDKVGWACTTGGPDTGDVYMLKVKKDMPIMYEHEGEWKTAELVNITFDVEGGEPFAKPAVYTELGPYIAEPDTEKGIAYVGATPYFEVMGLFEQTYAMLKADDCGEFYEALAMNQLMEQNLLFADTSGNIQYVRVGQTPIRPEGYDWSVPVPARPETQWQGIHGIEDLVQIKNPGQGYFQNCNISPELMMKGSPMTPDKYPDYIYNVTWDYSNPRGARLLELLPAAESMTVEQAKSIGMDVYDLLYEPWKDELAKALEGGGAAFMKDEDFAAAVNLILDWDGQYKADSKGAPLFKSWRLRLPGKVDIKKVFEGGELDDADRLILLSLMKETVEEFKTTYGSVDVAWGDIHKVGRGGQLAPCPGADYGGGTSGPNLTETLLDVRSKPDPDNPKQLIANNGSMAMMLMFMHEEGIESFSCIPWGQSGHPDSPHYMDQGRALYSNREWKSTWFEEEDLSQHVASEKAFQVQ